MCVFVCVCVCVCVYIRKKHYNLFSADDLGTLWPEASLTISPLSLLPNSRSVGLWFSTLAAVKSSGVLYKVGTKAPPHLQILDLGHLELLECSQTRIIRIIFKAPHVILK